ncbi:MAG: hypothetical protein FWG60_04055 [Methanomassiliicoccaceae archaeon]|nr:hypothetical protein [Methanomassiliicoccaceae archaeon]
MARRQRRIVEEKEEEYEFTPSEFDEREFILKDIYGTKVLFVITGLAVLMGIIGSFICKANADIGWIIATLVALLFVLIMKRLLMLMGFRADLLEMKTLLMDYLLFLMLALGLCIVLINPPFVGVLSFAP